MNARYEKQVDNPLLPDSSAQIKFFNQDCHQFFHVLTLRESGAFVRICEDRIFSSPLDKTPQHTYTVLTAELTRGTLAPFVLQPRTQDQAPGVNLPPELAARYTLDAPADFTLPPAFAGFLKAGPVCYIECTPHAFIYCEFNTLSAEQLQALRFRILQLLKELSANQPAPQAAPSSAPLTDEVLQAHVMLKLQTATPSVTGIKGGRHVYAIVLLMLLGSLLFVAWYALHHWVAH